MLFEHFMKMCSSQSYFEEAPGREYVWNMGMGIKPMTLKWISPDLFY